MSEILIGVEDCREMYRRLERCSLDLDVSDPPGGTRFMNLAFDSDRGGRDAWIAWLAERKAALLPALKPGAYTLTWALPRTSFWTGMALDNAGLYVVDVINHVFGQGWNKNGALLRPGHEMWYIAQRPIEKGLTIEQNVEKWGTGELNIEACRVPRGGADLGRDTGSRSMWGSAGRVVTESNPRGSVPTTQVFSHCVECEEIGARTVKGNVLKPYTRSTTPTVFASGGRSAGCAVTCLAGCDGCGRGFLAPSGGDPPACAGCGSEATWWACPVAELDQQSGDRPSGGMAAGTMRPIGGHTTYGGAVGQAAKTDIKPSTGGASRFFKTFWYGPKVAATERHAGCGHLFWAGDKASPIGWRQITKAEWSRLPPDERAQGNPHATIKSLALLRWLITLAAPPVERVPRRRGADGFCGAGASAIAADQLGIDWTTCDVSREAVTIAESRLSYWRGGLHVEMPVREGKRKGPRAKPEPLVAHDIPGGLFAATNSPHQETTNDP